MLNITLPGISLIKITNRMGILILGDSNTTYIKDILDRKTCKKVFCQELTITKQLEKILLRCRCDVIDSYKKETSNIFGVIDESIKTLQKTFLSRK